MGDLQGSIIPHFGIEAFSLGYLLTAGFTTHRLITDGLAVLHNRHHIGIHPIVIPIFTTVFDEGSPRIAGLDRLPEVFISSWGHIWVAHDIVWTTDQFHLTESADLNKILIDEGNVAL